MPIRRDVTIHRTATGSTITRRDGTMIAADITTVEEARRIAEAAQRGVAEEATNRLGWLPYWGKRGPHMKWLRLGGHLYLTIGVIYGLWAFVVLSFRNCPSLSGGACLQPSLWTGVRQLAIAIVAAFRGLLWLPEMAIAASRGQFLDWLFLRNFYNLDVEQFLKVFFG
ncbi:hypothetical protein KMZ29_17520 [Bradyrhizobium sediminis]|uniref:Uncharacterized protein n=1 Tax=Bradyrhizobium sediminis TaxID=2840469 RepID=A0A975NC57_9BRAD|nr:hypothetical protein [Bradyrhizobium sediminis]QWG11524.1 hypothetical protein KMZ29_17520 [Bradyrhizobium sediminis]